MASEIVVRVNGTIPAFSELGQDNARLQEVESNPAMKVNTSCSLIINENGNPKKHILIDAGNGVANSVKQECNGILSGRCSVDALLLTHSHPDRIDDLPAVIKEFGVSQVYCTRECWDNIGKKFPDVKSIQHTPVEAGKSFEIDGIKFIPVGVKHASDAPGSVAYVAEVEGKKIIFAWDVLSFVNSNDPVLKGADLVFIDTFTYNPHPETGHLSVLQAYDLIKIWNPKEAYFINYSGYQDFKNQENPYARVPKRPLTSDELASQVMSDVAAWGSSWNERVKVANHAMIWSSSKQLEVMSPQFTEDSVKLFTERNYQLVIKRGDKRIDVSVETDISKLDYEFINYNVQSDGRKVTAKTKGGFMAKPIEMVFEIDDSSDPAIARINISGRKGIKVIDKGVETYQRNIPLNKDDADKLRNFLATLK